MISFQNHFLLQVSLIQNILKYLCYISVVCSCTMESIESMESTTGICLIFASFCVFFSYTMIVERLVKMPQIIIDQKSSTKFINTFVSFTHASIAACWALYCFYTDDDILSDMINHWTMSTYLFVCFSGGYFLSDTWSLLRSTKCPMNLDDSVVLLHHIAIEAGLCAIIVSHRYVNVAAAGLLVEVNTVFLHFRTMLKMLGVSKTSAVYKVNGILNMLSLIVFRVGLFCWLFRWGVMNFYAGIQPHHTILTITLFLVLLVCVATFGQVLVQDDWVKFPFPSKSPTPSDKKST